MKKYLINIITSKTAIILYSLITLVIILDILFPLPQPKDYSTEVIASDSTLLTAYLTEDDKWRLETKLKEITPELKKAIIEKEDQYFYWHMGVNPFAVARALYQNVTSGERVSGASTITMQLARMFEPADRNYFNKFLEMLRAVQLELNYSKDGLLEMYLSMLPYGGNVEGVRAASYIYFDRPPAKLSLSQSILLAVIPNDPNGLRIDKNPTAAKKKRNQYIRKFLGNKVFSTDDLKNAMLESIKPARYSIPFDAPHLSYFAANKHNKNKLYTTLNKKIQSQTEELLKTYVKRVKAKGVSNGSVLVIDNKSSSVRAYSGSFDFFNEAASVKVNGIEAIRSPGSTLKPFLYAKALDKDMLTPKRHLLDIPTEFSGYQPDNYNLEFNGSVTAEFALMNSLNVPAVRLLQDYSTSEFIEFLGSSGFESISENKSNLGLSLILGGCGVTLSKLTRLYAAFGNGGKLRSFNYLLEEHTGKGRQVFSEEAPYLTAQILSKNERPDFPAEFQEFTNSPKIAWKTGTSYGKRDAWAVGFNPRYTIGVWMGNFIGNGSPYISGADIAVPLLFELFNSIDNGKNNPWFKIPEGIVQRKVCAETGLPPTEHCKNLVNDYAVENVSSN